MKGRPVSERIGFALAGLRTGWRREHSFRMHGLIAVVVTIALIALRPAPVWWALVAVVMALVFALELVNSAIEAVIDLLHPGLHDEIKAAKDMVAGAVLSIGLAAIVVGGALLVSLVWGNG